MIWSEIDRQLNDIFDTNIVIEFYNSNSYMCSFLYSVDFSRAKSWVSYINHKPFDLQKIFQVHIQNSILWMHLQNYTVKINVVISAYLSEINTKYWIFLFYFNMGRFPASQPSSISSNYGHYISNVCIAYWRTVLFTTSKI